MRCWGVLGGMAVVCMALLCGALAADEAAVALSRQAEVEADWLLQAAVGGQATTQSDALGAVDGVKNGRWGFHTDLDDAPWWQVDLGSVQALARVVIYNRREGCEGRAANLSVLLSDDGEQWHEVYRHNGQPFGGYPDETPLVVPLNGAAARFVQIQLREPQFLHLDEVEVYGTADESKNLALWQAADQSSISLWSVFHCRPGDVSAALDVERVLKRGRALAESLSEMGVDVEAARRELEAVAALAGREQGSADRRALYMRARWAIRRLAFRNPLLSFDSLLFAKRVPSSFSHMSDQYYGWWSRPGGGLYILEGLKSDAPRVRCLTEQMPGGSFLRPDLSADGRRILFAYCRYYPQVAGHPDKVHKENLPEDAFYHVFEMNVDGSGLRQLTRGRYDDFDARYLPSGDIVFCSTRRGVFVQCTRANTAATLQATLPDCYVRCGGDSYRPVSVYTLHVMDRDGGNLRPISAFESFEWNPSVAADGRILYSRWDYVDRNNMPYMKLWSTLPDGTDARIVWGNFTPTPHCTFEARQVPGSNKIIFTASAHHCISGGSLVMLDPTLAQDGLEALTRLTPEVCFPEVEGWPLTYYANPWPLSEDYYLTEWSPVGLLAQGVQNPPAATGLYLYDRFGNLELIYRDPDISCMFPIPLQPREEAPVVMERADWDGPQEARMLLTNVYAGLPGVAPGSVKRLRIVAVPVKTQPPPNNPVLGVTGDDPGKCVLGTVPVAEDGSAFFRMPSGMPVFFQALDEEGLAVQTMRSVTYAQPGQVMSCAGCHEPRNSAPRNARPLAVRSAPAMITPGPEGSRPLRFDRLVQPVLDQYCVSCHRPDGRHERARAVDLTPERAYDTLISYGSPCLRDHVRARYYEGRSVVNRGAAQESPLLALLREGHHRVALDPESLERLVTWIDTYGQRQGSFSEEQEIALAGN